MNEERDYESEAKEQGWSPDKDGLPEGKWVDAKTFVEKGERIAGIMKSRLDRQDTQIRQLQQSNKEFGEYQGALLAKEKSRNAELLAKLETQRAQAINDGDGAAFTNIDREIQQTREDLRAPEPQSNGGNQLDPLQQAFLLNNDWYQTNEKLATYADGVAEQVINGGYTGPAYYTELTRRVKDAFPEEFQNKRQTQSTSVESGGELETKGSEVERSFDNLPADAKKACDEFVKGGFTTREDYVANYEFDE